MKYNHHVLQSKGTIENQQTNKLKHLGVTLTKHIKDLHEKNFRSLKKEIEEDFIKWKKNLPCSWIGRINIVKWPP